MSLWVSCDVKYLCFFLFNRRICLTQIVNATNITCETNRNEEIEETWKNNKQQPQDYQSL